MGRPRIFGDACVTSAPVAMTSSWPICRCIRHGIRGTVVRSLIGDPLHPWRALTRAFGVSWLRFVECPVPLVAADFSDYFGIRRPSFFLLDKADVVFKRELPADRWQVIAGSAHPALPTLRIRSNRRWQERLEKLRPIALPPPQVDAVVALERRVSREDEPTSSSAAVPN